MAGGAGLVSEQIGLDEAARRELDVTLQAALAMMPAGAAAEVYERAINELIMSSGTRWGRAAMFELAYTSAVIVTGGELRFNPEARMEYAGFGPDLRNAQAGTPMEYTVTGFATAAMHGDRERAWQLWRSLTGPDDRLTEDAAELLGQMMRNAWSRLRTGSMSVTLNATLWPPTCDFCCGPPGVVMWECVGADITMTDPRGNGQTVKLTMNDVEYWFACRACRPYLIRRKIDWEPLWRRHKANRPRARKADTFVLFKLYETIRRGYVPVPLPAQRPLPKGRPSS